MATIAAGYGKQRHSSVPCRRRSTPSVPHQSQSTLGSSNHVLLSGTGVGLRWSKPMAPSTSACSPSRRRDLPPLAIRSILADQQTQPSQQLPSILAQMNAEVAEMEEESTSIQTNIEAEVELEQRLLRSSSWRDGDATSDCASTVSTVLEKDERIIDTVETDEESSFEEPGSNLKRDVVELEAYQEIVKILSSDRDALEQRCQEVENKLSQCSAELAAALNKLVESQAEKNDLQSKLADCQEQGRCVICLSETADQIVLPCAHLALCTTCRVRAGTGCPVCRQTIQSIIQVYKP